MVFVYRKFFNDCMLWWKEGRCKFRVLLRCVLFENKVLTLFICENCICNLVLETMYNINNASVNSSCAQHPPPRATAGHLPALSVPRVGHLQILSCPGAGHLPAPGPFLTFWHARGLLSENNYTEDFTGKESRLAHLSRTGKIEEVCKGMFLILCMHFFIAYRARIT